VSNRLVCAGWTNARRVTSTALQVPVHEKKEQRMISKRLLIVASMTAVFAAPSALLAAEAPAKKSGDVYVNSSGMTLYTFDKDAAGSGKSACNGTCANLWPALAAPADAKPSGDWTVVTRDDGAKQWAYKGRPLYTWVKDQKAGDKTGEGVGGVWHALKD
jgi:predicted lipoprotein with Yx(FWY)xxD motif